MITAMNWVILHSGVRPRLLEQRRSIRERPLLELRSVGVLRSSRDHVRSRLASAQIPQFRILANGDRFPSDCRSAHGRRSPRQLSAVPGPGSLGCDETSTPHNGHRRWYREAVANGLILPVWHRMLYRTGAQIADRVQPRLYRLTTGHPDMAIFTETPASSPATGMMLLNRRPQEAFCMYADDPVRGISRHQRRCSRRLDRRRRDRPLHHSYGESRVAEGGAHRVGTAAHVRDRHRQRPTHGLRRPQQRSIHVTVGTALLRPVASTASGDIRALVAPGDDDALRQRRGLLRRGFSNPSS